jgi:hypothetical protein
MAMLATGARGQNLDQGKSGARLFHDGCESCHHSPRNLAKGRFRLTLYMFLQQHYATGSDSASALTSYLESVDGVPSGKASQTRRGGAKQPASRRKPHSPLRPPAAVPQQ